MVKWIVLAVVVALILGVLRVRAAGRRIDAILVETLGERPDPARPAPEIAARPLAVDLDGAQQTSARCTPLPADLAGPLRPEGVGTTATRRTAPDPVRTTTAVEAAEPPEPDPAVPNTLLSTTPVPPQHDRRRLLAS